MGNVIDITERLNKRKGEPFDPIVHEDPFLAVRASAKLEYTELGIETWTEVFDYAGIDITKIENLKEHSEALNKIRFSETPPFTN